jgi:hypothetical protein
MADGPDVNKHQPTSTSSTAFTTGEPGNPLEPPPYTTSDPTTNTSANMPKEGDSMDTSISSQGSQADVVISSQDIMNIHIKDQSLQTQVLSIASTLANINVTLAALSDSYASLKSTNEDVKGDLQKLKTDTTTEIQASTVSYDLKLSSLETKLSVTQLNKHTELVESIAIHKFEHHDEIQSLKVQASADAALIRDLTYTVGLQDEKIKSLEASISGNSLNMQDLEKRLINHIALNNERMIKVGDLLDETRVWVNDVECHGRRWAIRIRGLASPSEGRETTAEAKVKVIEFLATFMNIHNIAPGDIDCAHRVGDVKKFKQTMLVRFFRREIVEFLLKTRKVLKKKGYVIHEDTSYQNRSLLNTLSDRPEVEYAWCMGGKIFVKKHNSDQKIKISIIDDIDTKLADIYTPPETESSAPGATASSPIQAGTSSADFNIPTNPDSLPINSATMVPNQVSTSSSFPSLTNEDRIVTQEHSHSDLANQILLQNQDPLTITHETLSETPAQEPIIPTQEAPSA